LRHKLSILLFLLACFLGTNPTLWGQTANAVQGIRGYLDPRTGEFHPLPQPARPESDAEAAAASTCAASPCTGKFVVNFTITVDSTIVSTAVISCGVSATVSDEGGIGNLILETAAVGVARGSGSTVKCTVNLPYSWNLLSVATDTVRLTYTINVPAEPATASALLPSRTSSQEISPGTSIKIPASGSTTTETVTATI
jgi:hypothetical protein